MSTPETNIPFHIRNNDGDSAVSVSKTTSAEYIHLECLEIERMLLEKNAAYGDSALSPIRVFSRADSVEQIRVRIDDKLSRIARADPNVLGEDAVKDLIGYLVLYRIALAKKKLNEDVRLDEVNETVGVSPKNGPFGSTRRDRSMGRYE